MRDIRVGQQPQFIQCFFQDRQLLQVAVLILHARLILYT